MTWQTEAEPDSAFIVLRCHPETHCGPIKAPKPHSCQVTLPCVTSGVLIATVTSGSSNVCLPTKTYILKFHDTFSDLTPPSFLSLPSETWTNILFDRVPMRPVFISSHAGVLARGLRVISGWARYPLVSPPGAMSLLTARKGSHPVHPVPSPFFTITAVPAGLYFLNVNITHYIHIALVIVLNSCFLQYRYSTAPK